MGKERIIVAKFGGSTFRDPQRGGPLNDEELMPRYEAVADVLRELQKEARVVAVVSAPYKETDRIVEAMLGEGYCPSLTDALAGKPGTSFHSNPSRAREAAAQLLKGELRSTRLLHQACEGRGLESRVFTQFDDGFPVQGNSFALYGREDLGRTRAQGETYQLPLGITIVPGFAMQDPTQSREQRAVLLGRDGSDGLAMLFGYAVGADEVILNKTGVRGVLAEFGTPNERLIPRISREDLWGRLDHRPGGRNPVQPRLLTTPFKGSLRVCDLEKGGQGTVIYGAPVNATY